MSNINHVEDFLNPDFERYMSEKHVSVLLSHTSCSHEIAFPVGHDNACIGIDYASVETRGGVPVGSRPGTKFPVCNCVDEMSFDALADSWVKITKEQTVNSSRCFAQLLEHLEERNVLQGELPEGIEDLLLARLNDNDGKSDDDSKISDDFIDSKISDDFIDLDNPDPDSDCLRGLVG